MNQALPTFNKGSLGITLTVPFKLVTLFPIIRYYTVRTRKLWNIKTQKYQKLTEFIVVTKHVVSLIFH